MLLKNYIKLAGISKKALIDMAEISYPTLSSYIKGETVPPKAVYMRLLKVTHGLVQAGDYLRPDTPDEYCRDLAEYANFLTGR